MINDWSKGPAVTVFTAYHLYGLQQAVEAVGADEVNPCILDPQWTHPLRTGDYEPLRVLIEVWPLGTPMTTAQIETMIRTKEKKAGSRSALPDETFAYCAKYKDAQREGPIVCAEGFWTDPHGDRYVVVLTGDADTRRVTLERCSSTDLLPAHYRVAVVRKIFNQQIFEW